MFEQMDARETEHRLLRDDYTRLMDMGRNFTEQFNLIPERDDDTPERNEDVAEHEDENDNASGN